MNKGSASYQEATSVCYLGVFLVARLTCIAVVDLELEVVTDFL